MIFKLVIFDNTFNSKPSEALANKFKQSSTQIFVLIRTMSEHESTVLEHAYDKELVVCSWQLIAEEATMIGKWDTDAAAEFRYEE